MFLAIGVRWHHVPEAVSTVKKSNDRGPEPPTHYGINLGQALALKLTSDFPPTPLRLRKPTHNLGLAREKPLAFEAWKLVGFIRHRLAVGIYSGGSARTATTAAGGPLPARGLRKEKNTWDAT
jgi:hypothetical protein